MLRSLFTICALAVWAIFFPFEPAHAQNQPEQVQVSVKILEFQTTKGVETGLSAYFARLPRSDTFGRVRVSGNALSAADLTFPASTAAGITVFLDNLRFADGELELVLQALVDENRAHILARPRAMVMVGDPTPTVVKTVQQIPYENTQVVGSTAKQITSFEETGVTFTVSATELIDDDGNWTTRDDTYIRLNVSAEVKEQGQRIIVALDDSLAGGGEFSLAENAISVPEFIARSITTQVVVRDGQTLMLGGLYRNTESFSLATVPWLSQGEDIALGLVERFIPGNLFASPITSTFGNRSTEESRRELVFLIKAETWKHSFGITSGLGFSEIPTEERRSPTNILSDVIEGITGIPQGIVQGITGEERKKTVVEENLGSEKNP